MFYYLSGWEMRHLHTGGSCSVVSGQGCVIMTTFGPSLGGLPSLRKLCPIFRFVMLLRGKTSCFVHLYCIDIFSDVSRTRNGGIPQLLPLLAHNVNLYAPTNTNHFKHWRTFGNLLRNIAFIAMIKE